MCAAAFWMPKIVCNECGPMPRSEPRPANQFAALLDDDDADDSPPPAAPVGVSRAARANSGVVKTAAAERTHKES